MWMRKSRHRRIKWLKLIRKSVERARNRIQGLAIRPFSSPQCQGDCVVVLSKAGELMTSYGQTGGTLYVECVGCSGAGCYSSCKCSRCWACNKGPVCQKASQWTTLYQISRMNWYKCGIGPFFTELKETMKKMMNSIITMLLQTEHWHLRVYAVQCRKLQPRLWNIV